MKHLARYLPRAGIVFVLSARPAEEDASHAHLHELFALEGVELLRLERLSRETGGFYLRASSLGADLGPILGRIGEMETRTVEDQLLSTLAERFQWPLALAVAGLVLHLSVTPFRERRRAAA